MKSYKCLNPQCNHSWETNEDYVFECPKCHQGNFIVNNGEDPWLKKHVKLLIGILIAIGVVAMLIVWPHSETKVEVEQNKRNHSLSVTLKGSQIGNYSIRLYNNDYTYDKTKSYSETIMFSGLYGGPFTLEIKFEGNKNNEPKLSKYKKQYNFSPLENSNVPEIIKVSCNPEKLTKKIKTYTVTISTDTLVVPAKQTEYSYDGKTWQDEPKFTEITPGDYNFYARNKKEKSAVGISIVYSFAPYQPHIVQAREVNDLLRRICNFDTKAANELKRLCGADTKVCGLDEITNVSDLCTYIVTSGRLLTCSVTLNQEDNEIVESINIQ